MANYTGNVFNNLWNGDSSDEYANGAEGLDTLNGGGGNDTILGGTQEDVIDGGAGNDLLYGDIENISSSEGGYDTIYGGSGDDTIYAGRGWDIIYPGSGNDSIDGGDSWTQQDTLIYDTVVVDMVVTITAEGVGSVTDGIETDVFTRVERLVLGSGNDSVSGSAGRDYAEGGAGNDTLDGNDGNDTLLGGDGDDLIYGDAGNEQLTGGSGNDTLYGGSNGDTLTGGTGSDFLDGGSDTQYSNTLSFADLTAAVSITFSAIGSGTAVSGADTDTFVGFTYGSYYLTSYDDTLTGSSGGDGVFDRDGNDSISLLGGDDQIISGRGSDTIDGGDGFDMYYAESAGARVVMGLPTGAGTAGTDYLINIERVTLTAGADTFIGGEGSHQAYLMEGNDIAYASAGNDTLDGGSDLSFGLPNYLDVDTIDYSGLDVSVTYNAATGTVVKAGLGTDTITGFEVVILGNAGSVATGSSAKENIVGGTGNDSLRGEGGNDTLMGGNGDDTMLGGLGNDSLSGGQGNDSLSGEGGDNQLFGDEGNDTLAAAEGNDLLDGGIGNDALGSGSGDDTVLGGDGDDFIQANAGTDLFDGGTGNDTLNYRPFTSGLAVTMTAEGAGSVSDGTETDTFTGIENLWLGLASDTFIGSSGADRVTGFRGNDSLSGGAGNDVFFIGPNDGIDTIDGGNDNDAIVVTGSLTALYAAGIQNIETIDATGFSGVKILGSGGDDSFDLTTVTLVNISLIDGGAGNDLITGSSQNDVLKGNLGTDTLYGGLGDDQFLLYGSDAADVISGGLGTDGVTVMSSGLAIRWANVSGVEWIDATGSTGVRIVGGNGHDTIDLSGVTLTAISGIDGGAGNDTIIGSSGDDRITGNSGSDLLTGGGGNDVFAYATTGVSNRALYDRITDFAAGDLIDLSMIDASTLTPLDQAFTFIGSAAFSAAGQLRAVTSGGVTTIEGDTNGDGLADIKILLTNGASMSEGDFVL